MSSGSVSIVGLGYVGLATAVCLADRGLRVVGIDIDEKKVRAIGDGSPPFEERNVTAILRKTLRNGALTLASDYEGIADTDVSFVTVGTPSGPSGEIDLRYVEAASKAIGGKLKAKDGYHLVVVKSTVIPGTTSGRVVPILEKESGKKAGKEFGVAVNPEFLREGSAVKDTRRPGGLVLGVEDERSKKVLLDVYARFYRGLPKTIVTTRASAELIKYSINISRAAQLSLVNSLADICSRVPGGEMADVAKGLALLARMDARYLGAGIGYGGSCLPKDTRAIAHFADSLSTPSDLFKAALKVNEDQPMHALRLARDLAGGLEGKKVAVLGLAFKGGTDDVRESAAIGLVSLLLQEGSKVSVFDPLAAENSRMVLGDRVAYSPSASACLEGAQCCFIATDWEEFRRLTPSTFRKLMKAPIVVDGKRMFEPSQFAGKGVRYARVGTFASIKER